MSTMMDKWLKKATPGDKGLTRPLASARVSPHKNEVRSIVRGHFQNRYRMSAYNLNRSADQHMIHRNRKKLLRK